MYCPHCGKEIKTDGEFCPYCGKHLNEEHQSRAQSETNTENENLQWFYVIGSDKFGPVDLDEIKKLIEEGYIKRETYIWNNHMRDWTEAEKIDLLSHKFGIVSPSIPMKAVSSAYAWALATIPLLASYNAYMFTSNEIIITAIAIGLNILFFALDCRELKKAGADPGNWIWTGLFLVPVYLFVRGKKIGKQYGYGITWCILFLFTSFF